MKIENAQSISMDFNRNSLDREEWALLAKMVLNFVCLDGSRIFMRNLTDQGALLVYKIFNLDVKLIAAAGKIRKMPFGAMPREMKEDRWLAKPELRFAIREGGRTIGAGTVAEIPK